VHRKRLGKWLKVVDDGNKIQGEHLSCWSFSQIYVSFFFVMLETYISDEGEDDVDAYIDDGVVAPAVATDDEADDDFFV